MKIFPVDYKLLPKSQVQSFKLLMISDGRSKVEIWLSKLTKILRLK